LLTQGLDLIHLVADIKYQQALSLSDDDAEKPLRLMRAGDLFLEVHQQSRAKADLDKAIAVFEAAIRITPDGHQCQAELHGDLGVALLHRIQYFGGITDIDNAIFALEYSVMLTPDGHAHKPMHLNNLGGSFLCRFQRSGYLVDIEKAITARERAVHLTPDDHADKPSRLNNLGNF